MNRGKTICNALKAVRQQIADSNDIAYSPTECHHEGECAGTCPKCEQEMRYLEQQLDIRRAMGKAVSVVGISVGLAALTSCRTHKTNIDKEPLAGDVAIEVPSRQDLEIKDRTEGIVRIYPDQEEQDSVNACELAPIATINDSITGEENIFGDIDQEMPTFQGGQSDLIRYLEEHVVIPPSVKEKCRTVVTFKVERNGAVTEAKVARSSGDEAADAEALKVVSAMPKWVPGRINGQTVRVNYTLPVTFDPNEGSSQP